MRLRLSTSLAVGLLALNTAGCHHRMRDARHAYYEMPQDPQAAAPVDAATAEPQEAAPVDGTPNAPPPDDAEPEVAAPEPTTAPPEEVVASTEPPEPVYEEQTPQPSQSVVWVPGYWQPEGTSWSWYVGAWRPAPVGYVYAEPHYERVNSRVVFVRGYWRQPAVPTRSYGGTKIVFVRPVRPADYHVSYQRPIHHVNGLPTGARLEPHYQAQPIAHTHYVTPPPRAQAVAAAPPAPPTRVDHREEPRRNAHMAPVAAAPAPVAAAPAPVAAAPAPPAPVRTAPPAPARVAMNAPPPAPARPAPPPPAPVRAAPPPPPPPAPVHAAPPPPPAARPAAPAPASTTKKKRP